MFRARVFGLVACVGVVAALILLPCSAAVAQTAGVAPIPGPVVAWGDNQAGQLGNGTSSGAGVESPTAGASSLSLVSIAAGGTSGVGLDASGDVWTWGYDSNGQLGNGTTVGSDTPFEVNSACTANQLPMATAVAAEGASTLALATSGTVYAWGYNNDGELGNATTSSTPTSCPVAVSSLTGVQAIAGGEYYGMALRADGTVWTWGLNNYGQLGNGNTTAQDSPVEVTTSSAPLANVIAIAAGGDHGLALESNGTVWAWGYNANGELGNGTTTNSDVAVQVSSLPSVVAISGGGFHSLALTGSGAVYAWGDNANGELGNNSTTNSDTPVLVSGISGQVVSVSGGYEDSLAMTSSGAVWAWGGNNWGQLGVGSTTDSHVPVQVTGVSQGAEAIAAGDWGYQSYMIAQPNVSISPSSGSLVFSPIAIGGQGAAETVTVTNNGAAPLAVYDAFTVGPNATSFTISGDSCSGHTVTVGSSCSIGISSTPVAPGTTTAQLEIDSNIPAYDTDVSLTGSGLPAPASGLTFATPPNRAFAMGDDSNGQLGIATVGGANVETPGGVATAGVTFVALATGEYHTLGLRADGTVWGWGANGSNQLGNSSTIDSWSPVQVPTPEPMVAVAAGDLHSLALGKDGTVWAWGDNAYGELGNGTLTNASTPVEVTGLSNIAAISAGTGFSLALSATGSVWAWGWNTTGELGNGTYTNASAPVQVSGLTHIVAIAAGAGDGAALSATGTVYTWGYNAEGQLGNGTTTTSNTPVTVSGISNAVAIAAGSFHTLALLSGGSVEAWGGGGSGQLGNAATTNADTPVGVSGLSGVTQIAASYHSSLALTSTGQAWAWGDNTYGELGIGSTTSQDTPVQITTMAHGVAGLGGGSQAYHSVLIAQPYAQLSGTLVFGSEPVGTPSTSLAETVTNAGAVPLQITQDSLMGQDGDEFAITGDGCAGTSVPAGGTCTIGVRFDPKASGTPAGVLRITSNSPTSPDLVTLDPGAARPSAKPKRPTLAGARAQMSCHRASTTLQRLTLKCTFTSPSPRPPAQIVARLTRGIRLIAVTRVRGRMGATTIRIPLPKRLVKGRYVVIVRSSRPAVVTRLGLNLPVRLRARAVRGRTSSGASPTRASPFATTRATNTTTATTSSTTTATRATTATTSSTTATASTTAGMTSQATGASAGQTSPASSGTSAPSAGTPSQASGADCTYPQFNALVATDSQLQACNMTKIPLTDRQTFPDGGSLYQYDLGDGQVVSLPQTPTGFNAVTASPAQDSEYLVPPAPPVLSPGYAAWQQSVADWGADTGHPAYLVLPPESGSLGSESGSGIPGHTWAGYIEFGSDWTEAQAKYTEPSIAQAQCSHAQVSFWAGIGGYLTGHLGQDGTASGVSGFPDHSAWYEVLPALMLPFENPQDNDVPVEASTGQSVTATTYYDGGGHWAFTIKIGSRTFGAALTGAYDGSTAEAIVERPQPNGWKYNAPLDKFTYVKMTGLNGRILKPLPAYSYPATMHGFATTGALLNGSFSVTDNYCAGHPIPGPLLLAPAPHRGSWN
jgi:alpha-tubulin suppressor-like RCC1 family protein